MNKHKEHKICPACDRIFYNRKKWASRGIWQQVIYCSKRCQRSQRGEKK